MEASRVRVTGRVQRVGYRRFVLDVAHELGVAGNVKNLPDGSVQMHVQGEKRVVEEFLKTVRSAAPPVVVKGFEVEAVRPKPRLAGFTILSKNFAEELQESLGSVESAFRDYRTEFAGFASGTGDNFHQLGDRYDVISQKLTSILEVLEKESAETRRELTRAVDNLSKLVEQYVRQRGSSPP